MSTLTKLALGMIGQTKARPAQGESAPHWALPAPSRDGGMSLLQAMWLRHSQREFSSGPLPEQQLSDLLWAAGGINRPALGGCTVPSAMNAQELRIYAAMPQGLFRYEPLTHALECISTTDVRAVTGYQDFVDDAALDLVYVADHHSMKLVPAAQREPFACVSAGAAAQNVYLYCASAGLAALVRCWFDRKALSDAMALDNDEQLLLTQTVGLPRSSGAGSDPGATTTR